VLSADFASHGVAAGERALVNGIERADSLAFDLHKWLHVPYDAGCVLVRNAELHRSTFADESAYLARVPGGTAGGEPWFTDFGPELSRGFRALKIWFTLKEFGFDRFGKLIARQCEMARTFAAAVARTPPLRMLAPVSLNIVCFRYEIPGADDEVDALNARIVLELQQRGVAVPSTTRVNGKIAIRMNVMNHRTTPADLEETFAAILACGSAARPQALTSL